MDFNLRKLKSDDLFLMFSILSKIGFKDIKEELTPEKVKKLTSTMTKDGDDMTTAIGVNILMNVVEIVTKNLPNCKNEIYSFLASVSGMTVKEIADLDMVTFTELVIAVVQKEEFKDFFKVVAKLFK